MFLDHVAIQVIEKSIIKSFPNYFEKSVVFLRMKYVFFVKASFSDYFSGLKRFLITLLSQGISVKIKGKKKKSNGS